MIATPPHHGPAEKARATAARRGRRRTTGSKRHAQAAPLCGKQQQHRRRQRSAFQHTPALARVRQYEGLSLQDVQGRTLVRTPHLATRSSAAGWAALRTIRAGTAAGAGKRVVALPPAYTSQDGSGCGERVPKRLSVRTPVCPSCGLVLDRDAHAASNRHWAGPALRGLAGLPAGTNPEAPCL